ncbi:ribose-phosphate diphosphokinase [Phenylobacterium montanum]|uniref:Ribose-phosphate diphosphokinase n=1 Tax=Phenylobacterium montanum TaxID=2823693 RepID=A0A975G168_9CAUL|nr:ribose-phosphate diphosphokinase [Caulobacter sp. S6]QUD88704.1 ribose-phosphate diphosphokinase [Caulobacter sp. S6]
MSALVCAFADQAARAEALASSLKAPFSLIDLHRFPDGEGLPTVGPPAETVLVYCSLDRPDAKIMPLALACDAWRRAGVRRLVLVAPYLAYMRQDKVFAAGQPVSRDVIGEILGCRFDRIVTVEPHLHRTRDIGAVFGTEVTTLSAARVLADAIGVRGEPPLLIGPDEESARWTAAIADLMDAPHLVLSKTRLGDRRVELSVNEPSALAGRRVVLVDDICSSGATLAEAARLALRCGARSVEAGVVHALFDHSAAEALKAAGLTRIVSTDSCPHPTNVAPLASLLADALAGEIAS